MLGPDRQRDRSSSTALTPPRDPIGGWRDRVREPSVRGAHGVSAGQISAPFARHLVALARPDGGASEVSAEGPGRRRGHDPERHDRDLDPDIGGLTLGRSSLVIHGATSGSCRVLASESVEESDPPNLAREPRPCQGQSQFAARRAATHAVARRVGALETTLVQSPRSMTRHDLGAREKGRSRSWAGPHDTPGDGAVGERTRRPRPKFAPTSIEGVAERHSQAPRRALRARIQAPPRVHKDVTTPRGRARGPPRSGFVLPASRVAPIVRLP